MKFIITVVAALGLAIGFAMLAMEDPGYVVLARAPYAVRMPLALFILAVCIAFAGLYLLFNFIGGVLRAPGDWRKWRLRVKQRRAQTHTMQGYARLIAGQWPQAEKKLLARLPHHPSPLLNYLGAAYAAQQQNQPRRRDAYLAEVLARYPAQWLAIGLTKSRLHAQAGEWAAARAALEQLAKRAPKNIAVARLRADVCRELQDWDALTKLMPTLSKLRAFPPGELARREQAAYAHYLASPALRQGADEYSSKAFQSLPADKQKDPGVVAGYVRQLLRVGEPVRAEKILRRALNRGWDARLVYLYGRTATAFTDDQIKLTESWVKKYGAHAELTLCLARLHQRARRWEKARAYYFEAVAEGGRAEARVELGALLERMGESEAALICYREGMAEFAPAPDAHATPPAAGQLVDVSARDMEMNNGEPADATPILRQ